MPHIVWDWNGTLLDDLAVVLDAVNASLAHVGWDPISLDEYRTHYTRPVRVFYERLAGRPVGEGEWHEIDELFHVAYRAGFANVKLAVDTERALEMQRASGSTQSLLSMFPHDELVPLVEQFGLCDHFARVDGLRGTSGSTKAASLGAHLQVMGGEREVVVVGDTPDDIAAARLNRVSCVVYDGGSHHRAELEALGAPIASSLVEAVEHAMALVSR
ncbi:MAG: HAD hydrolase-like protein [Acidimicrobiia bacterium]|nr:HAD hydrolase-like protein [Acidimicrobiia bacterium]